MSVDNYMFLVHKPTGYTLKIGSLDVTTWCPYDFLNPETFDEFFRAVEDKCVSDGLLWDGDLTAFCIALEDNSENPDMPCVTDIAAPLDKQWSCTPAPPSSN